jgi:hypothetical protein
VSRSRPETAGLSIRASAEGAAVISAEPGSPPVRTRRQRLALPVLLGGGILLASLALHVRDPHRAGSWGYCPWLLLTGTYCPGCGGLRAVDDLTRGDLAGAASSNLLLVAALPFLATWWLRSLVDGWRGVCRPVRGRRAVAGCVVLGTAALLFAVARNTPAGAWLAP